MTWGSGCVCTSCTHDTHSSPIYTRVLAKATKGAPPPLFWPVLLMWAEKCFNVDTNYFPCFDIGYPNYTFAHCLMDLTITCAYTAHIVLSLMHVYLHSNHTYPQSSNHPKQSSGVTVVNAAYTKSKSVLSSDSSVARSFCLRQLLTLENNSSTGDKSGE